jgi:hypothetical protein
MTDQDTNMIAVLPAEGDDEDTEQKIINEGNTYRYICVGSGLLQTEYKTWKKNSPFLYDMILRYRAHLEILQNMADDWKVLH